MLSKTELRLSAALLFIFFNFLIHSAASASLHLLPKHDHHNHHHSCHVSKSNKDCVFKSIALPVDQFDDTSVNKTFMFIQHEPSVNQTGFAWINWQGEKGLLPTLSELAQNNPSQSYHNPFDQHDKTPNVNDWMYSATLSDIENIDIAIKFKLIHKNKQVWIPLWKAQSTLQDEQEFGWNKFIGWVKNKTCKIGLGISHLKDGQVVANFGYVLDAAGQRLSMIENTGRSTGWAYDSAGRLIAESVQQAGQANRDSSYTYDDVGNRIEQTVAGAKTNYSYDANDRLITEDKAGVITNYTYDNQGNTLTETKASQVTQYSYNAEHELVNTSKAGMNASYSYSLNGIRTEQTINGVSTRYLNDNNMPYASVLMAIQNQQPLATYTYGDDLISYHQGTGSQYYLYDGLGSTRALASTNGQVTDTYTYDAYGETLDHQGSSNNAYQYAGEQKDETGHYYLRARYYNPGVGRFTQMDTYMGQSGNPITLHKYLYANASPTMYTDPSGHFGFAGGFSFGGFASVGYATAARTAATNVGPRLINSLVKPVAASKRVNAMPSFTNLLYSVVRHFCMTGAKKNKISDRCKPDMGLIVYGEPHDELTEHISDAYGSLNYPQVILKKRSDDHDRTWMDNYRGAGQACANTTRASRRDCDEYPFASTEQGGKDNFNDGNVSIRGMSDSTNRSGGNLLMQLYDNGGVGTGDDFIVLASTSIPISFFIGSNGYSSVSLRQ